MTAEAALPESELRAGHVLGGKYRLEGEIGRGAMGTVWSAQHESLGQRVAIKVISPEHAHSDELRRRFDTEARAAAKLRSRFVVGVYDHGTTKAGLPYIVMEFLEGECLEDRLNRQGVLSLAEVARITRHVGRALARAHANGIVHRDLKPANIFLTKSEEDDGQSDWIAKVLDFGIAKVEDFSDRSTTKTGTVLGTPLFMSPEQVRGASSVDSRADLYSLGMVVYNMLTGTYAFEGQSFGDLLVSICTDPLPRLTDRAPHLPASLDDWFQKACARDAGARFQTAEELVAAFGEALGETPSIRLSVVDGPQTLQGPSNVQSASGLRPLGQGPLPHHSTQRSAPHLAETQQAESGIGTFRSDTNSEVSGEHRRSSISNAATSTLTVNETMTLPKKGPSLATIGIGVAALAIGVLLFAAMRPTSDGAPEAAARPTEIELDRPAPPPDAPTAQPPATKPSAPSPGDATPVTAETTTPSTPTPDRPTTGRPPKKPPTTTTTTTTSVVTPPEVKPDPKPRTPDVPDVGF